MTRGGEVDARYWRDELGGGLREGERDVGGCLSEAAE